MVIEHPLGSAYPAEYDTPAEEARVAAWRKRELARLGCVGFHESDTKAWRDELAASREAKTGFSFVEAINLMFGH